MTGLARRLGFVMWCALLASASPLAASSLNDAIKPDRMTLDNGLEVWLKSRAGSGSVSILAAVKVGRRYETLEQRGLAHFVEHMVFEGTMRHSRKQMQGDLMARGGQVSASTPGDATCIGVNLPTGNLEFGLDWLAGILFNSTFPDERIEVERGILLREWEGRDPPELWWRLGSAMSGANSGVEGPADRKQERRNIRRGLQRRDLVRFYREQYVPNNIVLAVVGDFDLQQARHEIARAFGGVRRGAPPHSGARRPLSVADHPVSVADSGYWRRSAVWCGYAVPRCDARDFDLLGWLAWLVSYRAGERIREGEGLAYDVTCYHPSMYDYRPEDGKPFMVCAVCDYQGIPRVEHILREELTRALREPPSAREIAMVRAAAASGWQQVARDNQSLAGALAAWGLWSDSPLDADDLVQGLTVAGLQQVARAYLKPQQLIVAYHRPPMTPRELAASAGLALAVLAVLMILAKRRNARLAPPADSVQRLLPSHKGAWLMAAIAAQGVLWGVPIAFVILWPVHKLHDFLFHHAMFGPDLTVSCGVLGLLSALIALGLSLNVKQVVASREGMLLKTRGFHLLLRPERIASVGLGQVNLRHVAIDPRCAVYGSDAGEWLAVRTAGGFTIYLGMSDAAGFVEQARGYLGESVVPPPQRAGSSAGACRAQGNGQETCPPPAD